MSLECAIPVLPVRDAAAASAFYVDKLGFRELHRDEGYVVLARDAVQIPLWAARDESWRTRGGEKPVVSGAESFLAGTASCRVHEPEIEALYETCRAAGIVHPNGPLADKPWGFHEFAVLDADGNLITFFRRLPPAS